MTSLTKKLSLAEYIALVDQVFYEIKSTCTLSDKERILDANSAVKAALDLQPSLISLIQECNLEGRVAAKSILAIGQGQVVFQDLEAVENLRESFTSLIQRLSALESFYDSFGGLIGYHFKVLHLINAQNSKEVDQEEVFFDIPEGLNLLEDTYDVRSAICNGIENMREIAEFYPLGGAGDRLNLCDDKTNEMLPAAQLLFCGRTLLEGLIRDLQGREFLHYRIFGKQLLTPLAIMTSEEKHNHQRILDLCNSNAWFGRDPERFKFFMQPLVPMVTTEGEWAMQAPLKPILKPGGHGVMWKAAKDQGVYDWLALLHYHKAIIRQINNPVAGLDNGILALAGIGTEFKKEFGFASCDRLVNAPEGMDVFRERKTVVGYEFGITNIEYTEFLKYGIVDVPREDNRSYSKFPANTNILFVNLKAIENVLKACTIPGMLINMKTMVKCYTPQGATEKLAGRLESTMQNIADYLTDHSKERLPKERRNDLKTFLTYNKRSKTLSVAKQAYNVGKSFFGTPEGCFFELMENYYDLLANYCHFKMPLLSSQTEYLEKGSPFVVLFHPGLGNLYSIISQKIRGGKISQGSEWIMEIAEADVENLNLEGSLIVESDAILGRTDGRGVIIYDSSACSRCTLINVTVKNKGIDYSKAHVDWKRQVVRSEQLKITLHDNAEFFAENVVLEGNMHFEVPSGQRLVIYQQGDEIAWHCEKIDKPSWQWEYILEADGRIYLEKNKV